ncbi:MAG: hypothetical protein E7318_00035 [Clostridiales bacterium]|nr:hypothetical protein [Clostridiales bacterium]
MKRLSLILLLVAIVVALSAVLAEQTLLTTTVPSEHTLTLSCGPEGTLIVNGTTLTEGTSIQIGRHEKVEIEIIPNAGYELETATVSSDYGVTLEGNTIVIAKMVQDFTTNIAFKRGRIPGDADNNGLVELADALAVLQYASGEAVTINSANANVNGDDKVDIHDALLIMQYVAGWNVTLK